MRSAKYTAIRITKVVGLVFVVLGLLLLNVVVSVFSSFWAYVGYVRQCANYRPKGVALSDTEPAPKLGPNVRGVFAMVSRTKSLEGWRGLYQGTTVAIILNYLLTVVSMAGIAATLLFSSQIHIPPTTAKYLYYVYLLVSWLGPIFLTLPLEVIMTRTMVYPHRVNWREPKRALSAVLSEREYKRFWRLYTLPGVLPIMLIRGALMRVLNVTPAMMLQSFRTNWIQILLGAPEHAAKIGLLRVLVVAAWSLLTVACTVPVYVIAVRLMIQRTEPYAIDQGSDAPDTFTPRTLDPTAEPVISLRPCAEPLNEAESFYGAASVEPYRGVLDCVRKMTQEEGLEVLGRGIYFTTFLVFWTNAGQMQQLGSTI
ncbi:hypothetical protein MYAM1_003631 [Malassezia yamatoensis]|uniref:Mitochondrial carrier protein n=1 Tax=Malassezia yamatoensis TaxID=253288 RepID=A0AAJ5YV84_9BASI|nr:hypothetical protein MYAM1_003631 [Malassezia yamatoensis]